MFRKLHIQMTIFSTLITGAILVAMTLVCLFIAEKSTKENSYTAFTNNVHSCLTHLEGNTTLSHQWLLQVKKAYGIEIEIRDNGNSLFFDKLNPEGESTSAFELAVKLSRETQGLDLENPGSVTTITKSTLFRMNNYYASTALIPKGDGVLSLIILYPLGTLNRQLTSQRISFSIVVLAAIAALAVFSWFFTRKMIRPLEKSRRKQTEFIASASHELRSPLSVILSSIQAMDGANEEDIHRFSTVIQKEGNRMAHLINDMLSLANADNHSWSILPSPCELDTLLLDTYEKYEPLMKEKKLSLDISLPEVPLSPCRCDASRITQVLGILLDNAISYVPAGGRIRLSLKEDTKEFYLSVADNGPGIPDEVKDSIFERFYRADASRNDKQHFGLGLCIAREIIHLHKGSLRISDTPGGGATFTIILPRQSSRPAAE
ncbi:HAMP domain-containing histidine kinase [Blautia schinkii]|nr:HAMP domain-containing histidine kinase [Blautia schinkii]